jgi:hypothetical protein
MGQGGLTAIDKKDIKQRLDDLEKDLYDFRDALERYQGKVRRTLLSMMGEDERT